MLLFLTFLISQVFSASIGDRLIRTYTVYQDLPQNITNAQSLGWLQSSTCDPYLGIPFNFQASAPSVDYPLTLYFTAAGQLAGAAVEVFGSVEQNLLSKGFFQTTANSDQWHISISFRAPSAMCSGITTPGSIGDRLVINANTIAYPLPTTEQSAISGKWHKGSCFYGMGHHYFYDLASAPNMSWKSANLLPVVTMFDKGVINAVFFASSTIQQGLFGAHWWEPIPLFNALMCKNTCDADCTFQGTSAWSTFHLYFREYQEVTCANDCSIACCP